MDFYVEWDKNNQSYLMWDSLWDSLEAWLAKDD